MTEVEFTVSVLCFIDYDLSVTASDVEKGHPHLEMIETAIKQFNIEDASLVLKAGDSALILKKVKCPLEKIV